ncbi:hypothetical protein HMPREF1640_06900 [Prevotella sp. S7-1-8]|uniref:hypothetical protein n=1 Tax=Prevotella sp. S7-1-8 TaxID=1284775 RepID=UPI00050E184E|nr:hypothetical protein [Prevotella sp. S7-1-8]KGF17569.1 hypothetical protein HMPREF1640_06900 [Prevotella sp. S7-1-8]
MIKRIYIQLLALIAILCYPNSLRAGDYSLAPSTGRKVYVPIHAKSAKAQLLITNYGRDEVKDFDYKVTFEGKVLLEGKYVLKEPLKHMWGTHADIDVPPHDRLSETELQVEITKVNGEPNRASYPYAGLIRATVTQVPHRRVVVEEYTGMWCRYCPRGIAVMENLEKNYPDDFIGIAIHRSPDPLFCPDYAWNSFEAKGTPHLDMNRSRLLSNFTATTEFEEERAMGADMDIDVSAQWDEEKECITVTPSVTFRVVPKDTKYSVAYVITEDGMTKPEWLQNNRYSGDNSVLGKSPEMDKFVNSPLWVSGILNNFTAIEANGVYIPARKTEVQGVYTPGQEDFVKNPIEVDQTQSFQHVFNIAHNRLLQDKSKLKVCVLLINHNTKRIENAAKCSIIDAGAMGMPTVAKKNGSATETARYTLDGRRIQAPQRGINIVKYGDGHTRKEIVTR